MVVLCSVLIVDDSSVIIKNNMSKNKNSNINTDEGVQLSDVKDVGHLIVHKENKEALEFHQIVIAVYANSDELTIQEALKA